VPLDTVVTFDEAARQAAASTPDDVDPVREELRPGG